MSKELDYKKFLRFVYDSINSKFPITIYLYLENVKILYQPRETEWVLSVSFRFMNSARVYHIETEVSQEDISDFPASITNYGYLDNLYKEITLIMQEFLESSTKGS